MLNRSHTGESMMGPPGATDVNKDVTMSIDARVGVYDTIRDDHFQKFIESRWATRTIVRTQPDVCEKNDWSIGTWREAASSEHSAALSQTIISQISAIKICPLSLLAGRSNRERIGETNPARSTAYPPDGADKLCISVYANMRSNGRHYSICVVRFSANSRRVKKELTEIYHAREMKFLIAVYSKPFGFLYLMRKDVRYSVGVNKN